VDHDGLKHPNRFGNIDFRAFVEADVRVDERPVNGQERKNTL
jgi:hypothetical protein